MIYSMKLLFLASTTTLSNCLVQSIVWLSSKLCSVSATQGVTTTGTTRTVSFFSNQVLFKKSSFFHILETTTTTTVTSNTIVFSEIFTGGVASNAQCTVWTSFIAQLTVRSYTMLKMSGTYDPVGITLTDPTIIANIALALRTTITYGPVTSNSRSWIVGSCGTPYGLSAQGSSCTCLSNSYIVRPCIKHQDYGGINSTTCSGPSQTMTVTFYY